MATYHIFWENIIVGIDRFSYWTMLGQKGMGEPHG